MPRVLLVVPTSSYRIADFMQAAEALGVEVAVAAEEDLPLLGVDRFVRIDCSDPESAAAALADLAATTSIDAIIPVDDSGVVIAAMASELLGLPHNPPAAAAATRDKEMMRAALARGEVRQPAFAAVGPGEDAETVAAALGYPLVVKPLSLSGSRGVVRVDDVGALGGVVERVRAIAREAGGTAVARRQRLPWGRLSPHAPPHEAGDPAPPVPPAAASEAPGRSRAAASLRA